MSKPIRLDKYLASVSDYSRSDAKKLIKAGFVSRDGEALLKPEMSVSPDDEILLDGVLLRSAAPRYFMLHKPEGLVCANKDRLHQTIFSLMAEDNIDKLHIAGRLDIDTTGLVLISDDGAWSHRVTHPGKQIFKTYLVGLAEPIDKRAVDKLRNGVFIEHDKARCLPAEVEVLTEQSIRLRIQEGRYHQVKQMLASVSNRVIELHREGIGDLFLGDLPESEYRELDTEEVALFDSGVAGTH